MEMFLSENSTNPSTEELYLALKTGINDGARKWVTSTCPGSWRDFLGTAKRSNTREICARFPKVEGRNQMGTLQGDLASASYRGQLITSRKI